MRTDDKISKYLNGFICLAAKGCVKAEVNKEKLGKEGKKPFVGVQLESQPTGRKQAGFIKTVYTWARQYFFKLPAPQKTY